MRNVIKKYLNKHLYWIWIAGLFFNNSVFSQTEGISKYSDSYKFVNLGKEIGLFSLKITDLYQDCYGFVWIATDYGLYRFDGFECVPYLTHPTDSLSISSNYIAKGAIVEDSLCNLWVATINGGLNYFDRKSEKFIRYTKQNGHLHEDEVFDVVDDKNGNLWLGTGKGLTRFDLSSKSIEPFYTSYNNPDTLTGNNLILSLVIAEDKSIWMGTGGGVANYDPSESSFSRFLFHPSNKLGISEKFVPKVIQDKKGRVWAGVSNGLNLWNPIDSVFEKFVPSEYFEDNQTEYDYILDILEDGESKYWLGTIGGLLYFDLRDTSFQKFKNNPLDLFTVNKGPVNSIMKDRDGNLWFGTDNGISILNKSTKKLNHPRFNYIQKSFANFRASDGITALLEVENEIYFTSQTGLYHYSDETKIEKILPGDFYSLYYSEGLIYAGTAGAGFYTINSKTLELEKYFPQMRPSEERSESRPKGHRINAFAKDRQGNLWIGANGGLSRYNSESGKFRQYYSESRNKKNSLSNSYISDLLVDKAGNLWIATRGGINTVSYLELSKPLHDSILKFEHIRHSPFLQNSISSDNINTLFEDSKGQIWAGTETGLNCYNSDSKTWEYYLVEDGLPDNKVVGIIEDENENLWLSFAHKGISCFNIKENRFQNLYKKDGLNTEIFNPNACIKTKDGLLVFGGKDGINGFNPVNVINLSRNFSAIYLTDFQIYNESVEVGNGKGQIKSPIYLTNQLILEYEQKAFSFQFAALNFLHPEKIRYRYKLDSFDEDWQYNDKKRTVTFTNIFPGNYSLMVENSLDGVSWNSMINPLKIKILKPWFFQWWAILLYLIGLFSLVYSFYLFRLKRRLSKTEAIRLKELNQVKSRLYSNITHEFRTPLTIILGMADQVKEDPKAWFSEGIELIRRNGKQLLNLVNQMLDLSKLESGNMKLKTVNSDIIAFVKYLIESFHSYADSKDIRLHFLNDFQSFEMDYDPEKLQNIISNLLSNAIKFTPAGGDVYVELRPVQNEENQMMIIIKDNGIGIAEKHLPHIFDRFYQIDSSNIRQGEGTGIGLALTKELVQLMGGNIKAKSQPDKGTTFIIRLPVFHNAEKSKSKFNSDLHAPIGATILQNSDRDQQSTSIPQGDTPLVLLIEDNKDVIIYLSSFLEGEYQIKTATNGQWGIEKAIQYIPDLIVSDVMMPEKNGYEVCEILKKDERTSHIPIILLTAKSDQLAKIEGLAHGADAYLAKPFNKDELLIRIEKLIELRKQMSQHFQHNSLLEVVEKKQPTPEELFLQKLIQIVDENLSDEHFGLPELCKKAGLSRSQLFRKLKALTGKSTTKFIRSFRLEKGKKLLETTDLTIAEIAFQVGFSNPNYFTRTFQETYGVSPSSFRNQ